MGVERAVTRWYVQRQILLGEIAELEEKFRSLQSNRQESENAKRTDVERQLAEAREKLRLAGSCPKPMMG